jgi:hypothetical protein
MGSTVLVVGDHACLDTLHTQKLPGTSSILGGDAAYTGEYLQRAPRKITEITNGCSDNV